MRFWRTLGLATLAAAFRFERSFIHSRADEDLVHIGYRLLNTAEMEAVSKNGQKAVQSIGEGARQLGPGIYLTPGFMQWPGSKIDWQGNPVTQWDCKVFMDSGLWNRLNKVWVPHYYDFQEKEGECELTEIWGMTPRQRRDRQKFVEARGSFTIANSVLFSVVKEHDEMRQALLPPSAIATNLVSYTECAKRGTAMHTEYENSKPPMAPWMSQVGNMPGWNLGIDWTRVTGPKLPT